jgi:hypothetical protein
MQKQQCVATRDSGTGIHLPGAPFLRSQDQVGQRPCQYRGAIYTAAINHDHLRALLPQRRQQGQQLRNPRGFVQDRNDNG